VIGLTLNPSKGAVLMPANAHYDGTDKPCMNVTKRGFIVAGAPIGPDDFIAKFVREKVNELRAKIPAILLLARRSPRAAHRLITVPPEFTYDTLNEFDQVVADAFLTVVNPVRQLGPMHPNRMTPGLWSLCCIRPICNSVVGIHTSIPFRGQGPVQPQGCAQSFCGTCMAAPHYIAHG